MTCRHSTFALLAAATLVAATVAVASAGSKACIREAKRDARDCGAACKEAYQTAKDACLNRDHDCVEICRADRAECRLGTGFDAGIDACNDILESNREACRTNNPPGADRDRCIDAAQVNAFECRDAVRESTKSLLKDCRKAFRTCAKACPAVDPSTLPVDQKTCVQNAKHDARLCHAGCKEAYQVAKDDCRHRDHDCMETCRATRHGCRQDVHATTLDPALAQCAADREAGIEPPDGCKADFPPPRDEAAAIAFDQCVDGVQVQAFICRDNAHEAARPGFASCHQQFRSCVQTNCPPID